LSGESPDVILYDALGNAIAVQNATATPSSTPLIMSGGSDGTNSRYIIVDTSGRQIVVGLGTAGSPLGGVVSIQGVASGTAVPVSGTLTLTTAPTTSVTSVAASASNVSLLVSNTSRFGATIWNDSTTATLYLKMGTTASTTSYTVQIFPSGYFEVPYGYTGEIDGIWSAAVGSARITEVT
jgi:hypothetical protein